MTDEQNNPDAQNDPDAGTASDEEIQAANDALGGDGGEQTNPDSDHFTSPPDDSLGQDQVHEQMMSDLDQGFIGAHPDPTPNENYTLQTPPDAPTPETDPDLEVEADRAIRGSRLRNVTESTAQTADHNQ